MCVFSVKLFSTTTLTRNTRSRCFELLGSRVQILVILLVNMDTPYSTEPDELLGADSVTPSSSYRAGQFLLGPEITYSVPGPSRSPLGLSKASRDKGTLPGSQADFRNRADLESSAWHSIKRGEVGRQLSHSPTAHRSAQLDLQKRTAARRL